MKEQKQVFDKTNYCFSYPVTQVIDLVNKKLNEENLNEYTLDVCGFLLTQCNEYLKENQENILLNAIESATIGAYNKRSVAAKKAAEKRKKTTAIEDKK